MNEALTASGKSKDGVSSGIFGSSESTESNAGNAGDISIQANTINLKDSGEINTTAENATGGNITVTTPNLLHIENGGIYTDVKSNEGDGGNITVETPLFAVLDGAQIITKAKGGDGGDITVASQHFLYAADANTILDASSELGIDGKIVIKTPDNDVVAGFLALQTDFLDSSKLFKEGCTPRTIGNTFLNQGHHKVSANNLLNTQWASFYSDSETLPQVSDDNRKALSLSHSLFGCRQAGH
ncbi:MAG TPA: hypothetical protein EYP59_16630 [Thiotrichaceae bacterium]|nr:hypothetical protein [Thiotrichaceae bacterium]